jgi:hypothetical protein
MLFQFVWADVSDLYKEFKQTQRARKALTGLEVSSPSQMLGSIDPVDMLM